MLRRADWVIDLGPGAGHHRGRVVFGGTVAQLIEDKHSITVAHLRRAVANHHL
ncbi:MAG: hypothetical protein ACRDQA_09625 [Nocardioidaceae bacterium]